VKRKLGLEGIGGGIEMDEVQEVHSDLWTAVDNYGSD
jgi:hypothetical protein